MLWGFSSFVRKKPENLSCFLFIFQYYMILFYFPSYLQLEAINRCSLLILQYFSISDMQRIMTFHISSDILFLNSKSFPAWLGYFFSVFAPSSVCGPGQGLSALVVWWPCGQLWPHCSLPSPSLTGLPHVLCQDCHCYLGSLFSLFAHCQKKASMLVLIS